MTASPQSLFASTLGLSRQQAAMASYLSNFLNNRGLGLYSHAPAPFVSQTAPVTVAQAAALQANARVTAFTVSDTAANVAAGFDALNADSKLTAVRLTTSGPLTITALQLITDTRVLARLPAGTGFALTGVTVSGAAAAQANPLVRTFSITDTAAHLVGAGGALASGSKLISIGLSDTAANVVANLGQLSGYPHLTSISLTGGTILAVTAGQYAAAVSLLDLLAPLNSLVVSGVTVAAAGIVAADRHVTHFSISDSLAAIAASMTGLEVLAKAGKLTAINVSDTGHTMTLSAAQLVADKEAIALMRGSFTIAQPGPPPIIKAPVINLIWDSSVANAPAGFKAAMQYAAQYFDTLITSPITVNIAVGYGEEGGQALGAGTLGEASVSGGAYLTPAQFKADLLRLPTSVALQSALANLSGATSRAIYVPAAEARALGELPASGTAIDGNVGFAADPTGTLFTYDPAHRGVAGAYDFIGVAEHELSHALGRVSFSGMTTALDLFRYAAPGVLGSAGAASYFSINGGVTNLDSFDTSSDPGDWASSAGNDANNAFSNRGVENLFTQTDVTQLNVLGYAIAQPSPSAGAVGNTAMASASSGLSVASLGFIGSPTVLAFGPGPASASVLLDSAPGLGEIDGFHYGLDQLKIDLRGMAGSLQAFDTTVAGAHAIALAGSGDLTHGLILTGMPADQTAAQLMASHLQISGGYAIIA